MADFTLPELGENIAAGDVVRVLVNPGDTVKKDQPVLELETDKATIEVPSSISGTVKAVKVKPGEKIKVGQVVLTLDEAGGGASAAAPAASAPEDLRKSLQPSRVAPSPLLDFFIRSSLSPSLPSSIDYLPCCSIGQVA